MKLERRAEPTTPTCVCVGLLEGVGGRADRRGLGDGSPIWLVLLLDLEEEEETVQTRGWAQSRRSFVPGRRPRPQRGIPDMNPERGFALSVHIAPLLFSLFFLQDV